MEDIHNILNEKILSNDFLIDIKLYLWEIYKIEYAISDMLKKWYEKKSMIVDENDYERQLLSLEWELWDNYFEFNKASWYDDFEKKIFEADLFDLINNYLWLLVNLSVAIDNSIWKLKLKSNDFYRLYYSCEAHKILDFENTSFKYWDFDYYTRLKKDYENLTDTCENNPYKIILNVYLYYLDIIYILDQNIKLESDDIIKQAKLVESWLKIDVWIFESLKKWEESIEVKEYLSIYDLIKK
jgi:hypothetical protein